MSAAREAAFAALQRMADAEGVNPFVVEEIEEREVDRDPPATIVKLIATGCNGAKFAIGYEADK
jgi:hypothetical protein